MILGIGNDLIDIGRIEKAMDRFGERFIQRCFTEAERQKTEKRRPGGTHMGVYAKRFAAKEAVSKALGTGFAQGVYMKDIAVENTTSGRPVLKLTGGALSRLNELTPDGHEPVLHLSLTDEPPFAQAFVVIEARPKT